MGHQFDVLLGMLAVGYCDRKVIDVLEAKLLCTLMWEYVFFFVVYKWFSSMCNAIYNS